MRGEKMFKDKKVVFMGTPLFATCILKYLIDVCNVVLVVTKEDKEVGRKRKVCFSPVKEMAINNNIEVFQPTKIRDDYEKILNTGCDIIITCAYGQIIPSELLEFPKYKCINVHASLLPKLRGGAPIHRAIINGMEETGISIMYMSKGMDEGDIISQDSIKIDINDNTGVLHDKLSVLGRDLLKRTLPEIFNFTNKRVKQNDDEATYGYVIKREDELIDFSKCAKDVYNQIRGLYPFPCGYMIFDNMEIKILCGYIGDVNKGKTGYITSVLKDGIGIMCLDREIVITRLKPSGKGEMSAMDYINGKGKDNLLGKVCK